jgi:hypothetical protein
MKKQFNDEQLDQMMRTLISDASANDSLLEEISDSPATWWAVRRAISSEKETAKAPWPPANIVRRWLMILVPAAAAAAVLTSLFVFRPTQAPAPVLTAATETVQAPTVNSPSTDIAVTQPQPGSTTLTVTTKRTDSSPKVQRAVNRETKKFSQTLTAIKDKTEIKSEFISLTYARNPESGQIVRVKVPSSMMVSLGVVASVAKPSAVVDAEVLIGDDGLTRAIRFIR